MEKYMPLMRTMEINYGRTSCQREQKVFQRCMKLMVSITWLYVHQHHCVLEDRQKNNKMPGHPEQHRQYHRLREMESFLRRAVEPDLDRSGLGLRLRYLSGGMSPSARLVAGRVIPERAGYYLGFRMSEALVAERGLSDALRAPVQDFQAAEQMARGIQSA